MTLERCPWYIAGPLIGLLMVGLRVVMNKPFGALGGYVEIVQKAAAPRSLGYRAFLLVGMVLGGLLYGQTLGSSGPALSYSDAISPGWSEGLAQLGALALAGVVMGVGARTAGGCTSGHGLSGMSLGSPASIVSTMTFFATAVALANGLMWLGGAR